MKSLEKITAYIRASPIAHGFTVMNLSFGTYLVRQAIENYSKDNPIYTALGTAEAIIALMNFGGCVIEQVWATQNFREYKKVRAALEEHGWDKRIIESKAYSWCQRRIAQVASDHTGFGKETRNYLAEIEKSL